MHNRFWWHSPAPSLELSRREVHVWKVCLDAPVMCTPKAVQALQDCLSLDELVKADRFYFFNDRRRYLVAHAALRRILAGYLHSSPLEVSYVHNQYGKPFLENQGRDGLQFNLSHSGGMALVAVSRSRAVGVDIEVIRSDLANLQIADKFFSRREVEILRTLMQEAREDAFFNCWTRKEAYLKARGRGFSLPLNQFEVSLLPGEPVIMLNVYADPAETRRWRLCELQPGPGYVASLAVEGQEWDLQCWQWLEGAEAAPASLQPDHQVPADLSPGVTLAGPTRSKQ